MDAKKLVCLCFVSLGAMPGLAQTVPELSNDVARPGLTPDRAVVVEQNNWLITGNPAAIGVITMPETGITQVGANHLDGDFHPARESGSVTGWGFSSNSYRSLKNLNLWGNFEFTQQRHRDRRYNDNVNAHNGNPFIAGSDIAGDYTHQIFDFDVALSSLKLFEHLYLGVGLDFLLGDFSRLQDPRSRVQYIDYTVRPGAIFEVNSRHRIGANFDYRYRKEKIGTYSIKSMTTPDDKFSLYLQEGLGTYSKKIATHFDRRIKGHYLGGEFQYEYTGERFSALVGGNYLRRKDRIEDKQQASPGDYASRLAGGFLRVRLDGPKQMQVLNVRFTLERGKSDKAYQELQSETDPETNITTSYYVTLFTEPAYKNETLAATADWTYYRTDGDAYRWYAGADAGLIDYSSRYIAYLPASRLGFTSAEVSLRGGYVLFHNERRSLDVGITAGGLFNLNGDLSISEDLPDDRQSIRTDVIEPDYAYWRSDAVKVGIELNYVFTFSKRHRQQGVLSPYFTGYFSNNGNRYVAGLSLGLLMKRKRF